VVMALFNHAGALVFLPTFSSRKTLNNAQEYSLRNFFNQEFFSNAVIWRNTFNSRRIRAARRTIWLLVVANLSRVVANLSECSGHFVHDVGRTESYGSFPVRPVRVTQQRRLFPGPDFF
jgi:hypothetical protein